MFTCFSLISNKELPGGQCSDALVGNQWAGIHAIWGMSAMGRFRTFTNGCFRPKVVIQRSHFLYPFAPRSSETYNFIQPYTQLLD